MPEEENPETRIGREEARREQEALDEYHRSLERLELNDCPQCGGPATDLGALWNRQFYRCRNCGWEWS
jgi:hypothetical protein